MVFDVSDGISLNAAKRASGIELAAVIPSPNEFPVTIGKGEGGLSVACAECCAVGGEEGTVIRSLDG